MTPSLAFFVGLLCIVGALQQPVSANTFDITISAIQNFTSILPIAPGDTVRWTNVQTGVPHTVTSTDNPPLFNSGVLNATSTNNQFTFNFTKPGVYNYICQIHSTRMFGTIIVVQPIKSIEFALSFVGNMADGGIRASASSQLLQTVLDLDGPHFTEIALSGATQAQWFSVVTANLPQSWEEMGNLTFGNLSTLFFKSNGFSGHHIGNFPTLQFGAITYAITGGTGVFKGCIGQLVDHYVNTAPSVDNASFSINVWGQVFFGVN